MGPTEGVPGGKQLPPFKIVCTLPHSFRKYRHLLNQSPGLIWGEEATLFFSVGHGTPRGVVGRDWCGLCRAQPAAQVNKSQVVLLSGQVPSQGSEKEDSIPRVLSTQLFWTIYLRRATWAFGEWLLRNVSVCKGFGLWPKLDRVERDRTRPQAHSHLLSSHNQGSYKYPGPGQSRKSSPHCSQIKGCFSLPGPDECTVIKQLCNERTSRIKLLNFLYPLWVIILWKKKKNNCVCVYVWVCVSMCVCASERVCTHKHSCEHAYTMTCMWRATVWVPGIELKSSIWQQIPLPAEPAHWPWYHYS
jgi:hypothetical protein